MRAQVQPSTHRHRGPSGIFLGGPVDGEDGPTSGERVTVYRQGRLHRYVLANQPSGTNACWAWSYAGVVQPDDGSCEW